MHTRRRFWFSIALPLCLLAALSSLFAQRKKHEDEPLPLPPELPMALAAGTHSLDFHISPLLRTGGLAAQIRQSLNDLIRDTRGETIVKLRAFVSGTGDARRVRDNVAQIFTERKLPFPVLSIVQVGGLGAEAAAVIIEAVVSTHRVVNPNGLAFLSGQTGPSLNASLERLKQSAKLAFIDPDRVLTCTCFTSRIEDFAATKAAIQATFPNTAVDVIQALRDPASDTSTCEAIAQLTRAPAGGPVVWLEKSHTTLVDSPQLVFTGLQLTFGNYLDDAHEAFIRLQRAASTIQPVEVPVKVDAFSLDAYAGSALRKTTPIPLSLFTIQPVEGLPAVDATAGIEAVLAPNVSAPVSAGR